MNVQDLKKPLWDIFKSQHGWQSLFRREISNFAMRTLCRWPSLAKVLICALFEINNCSQSKLSFVVCFICSIAQKTSQFCMHTAKFTILCKLEKTVKNYPRGICQVSIRGDPYQYLGSEIVCSINIWGLRIATRQKFDTWGPQIWRKENGIILSHPLQRPRHYLSFYMVATDMNDIWGSQNNRLNIRGPPKK